MYWGQFILFAAPNWYDTINGYCICWVLTINSAYSRSTYNKNKLETKLSSATGDEHRYIATRIQKGNDRQQYGRSRASINRQKKKRENRKAQTRHRTRQGRLNTGWIINESSVILLLLFMIAAGFCWMRHDTRRLFPFHGVVQVQSQLKNRLEPMSGIKFIWSTLMLSPSAESLCCGEHIWGI